VARAARSATRLAVAEGLKVGVLRLKTCWPFPDLEVRHAAESVKTALILENNTGQMYPYIKAEAAHACRVEFLGPQILGQIHDPHYILDKIRKLI
jgi:2-oxoglutarate ferredoxin oxidoreductase subunit alpha